MTGKRENLDFLQVFRAIAAVIVAMSHAAVEMLHIPQFSNSHTLYWMHSLVFGVDIFFVISGFIMVYTTRKAEGGFADAQSFLIRRLFRIVPVYWLYTSLFVALVLAKPVALHRGTTDLAHITASYLFWPAASPSTGEVVPVLALGWTLNYEMFFYSVFAVILLAPRRHLMKILLVAFPILCIGGLFIPESLTPLWYWTRSCILEFAFGAVIGSLFLRSKAITAGWCMALVTLGVIGWQIVFWLQGENAGGHSTRGVLFGIPAALIVGGVALCPAAREIWTAKWASPLIHIGDSSYSLYLVHMFAVRAVSTVIPYALFGAMYPIFFIPVATLTAIAVASVSYRWFERPVHDMARSFSARWKLA